MCRSNLKLYILIDARPSSHECHARLITKHTSHAVTRDSNGFDFLYHDHLLLNLNRWTKSVGNQQYKG